VPARIPMSPTGDIRLHPTHRWTIRCPLATRRLLLLVAVAFGLWLLAAVFHGRAASASPISGAGAQPAAARSRTPGTPPTPAGPRHGPRPPTPATEPTATPPQPLGDHNAPTLGAGRPAAQGADAGPAGGRPVGQRLSAQPAVGAGRLNGPRPGRHGPATGGVAGPKPGVVPLGTRDQFSSSRAAPIVVVRRSGSAPAAKDPATPTGGGVAPAEADRPGTDPEPANSPPAREAHTPGPAEDASASRDPQSAHPQRADPADKGASSADPQPAGDRSSPTVKAWPAHDKLGWHRGLTGDPRGRASDVIDIVVTQTLLPRPATLADSVQDSVLPAPDPTAGYHRATCVPGAAPSASADSTAIPRSHPPAWRPVPPRQPPGPDAMAGFSGAAASGGHWAPTSNAGALPSVQLPPQPSFVLGRASSRVGTTVKISAKPPVSPD
jgi:hypothetical protein